LRGCYVFTGWKSCQSTDTYANQYFLPYDYNHQRTPAYTPITGNFPFRNSNVNGYRNVDTNGDLYALCHADTHNYCNGIRNCNRDCNPDAANRNKHNAAGNHYTCTNQHEYA
jgi:hypothetical protein